MAKQNILTAAFVRNTKIPKLHSDGNGLFLQVLKTGGKSWLFRFRWQGKRPEIGLGGFTDVTLAQAREKAAGCRQLIRKGIDPRIDRKTGNRPETAKQWTFDECAEAYIAKHRAEWTNAKHAAQWTATLKTYVSPVIGSKPVKDLTIDDMENVLDPIWTTKTETATRVRARMESVIGWAITKGHRQYANPAAWKNNLSNILAKPSKVRKVRHHPALAYKEIPAFMVEIRKRKSLTSRALELTILTAARTQEIMGAQWNEFDLDAGIWVVPAARMKMEKEHRVPLVPAVVELLRSLPIIDNSAFLFPGLRGNDHMSNMAMLMFLKRDLARPGLTVHGFRSTFRDWAAEQTAFENVVCEGALAHVVSNQAEAAYRRGDMLERRRELMQAWGDYCTDIQSADVELVR